MEKMTKRNVYEALINYANGGAMAYAGDEGDVVVLLLGPELSPVA